MWNARSCHFSIHDRKSTGRDSIKSMLCASVVCGIARQDKKGVTAAKLFGYDFFLLCLLKIDQPTETVLLTRLTSQVLAWLMYYVPKTLSDWFRATPTRLHCMLCLIAQPSWRAAGALDEDNIELILIPLLEREEQSVRLSPLCGLLLTLLLCVCLRRKIIRSSLQSSLC